MALKSRRQSNESIDAITARVASLELKAPSVQVTSYSLLTTDSNVLFNISGSSTATLPTAVGVAGKIYIITSLGSAAVLTINTSGGQTIGGHASGALKMGSANDNLMIQSDGANWQILEMSINVSARYTTASNQSLPNATTTTVVYGTKDYDSLNAFNSGTGVFTAPFSGLYELGVHLVTAAGTFGGTSNATIQIFLNNGANRNIVFFRSVATGASVQLGMTGKSNIRLVAGDQVKMVFNTDNGTNQNLSSDSSANYFEILRVGN